MMNKKEQAYVAELETRLALRFTDPVEPDVLPTDYQVPRVGYSFNTYHREAYQAWTTTSLHGRGDGSSRMAASRGAKPLYSSEKRALQALRHELEQQYAKELYRIDQLIKGQA